MYDGQHKNGLGEGVTLTRTHANGCKYAFLCAVHV